MSVPFLSPKWFFCTKIYGQKLLKPLLSLSLLIVSPSRCVTAAPALPRVLLKVLGPAELPGLLGWAGRFNLWGRISPSKVLSRKHLVFPLHESGCHLSLPAARANFNGCSPSQGQRERAGTLSGVTAALRALWVLPIHRAHTGLRLCFLVAH